MKLALGSVLALFALSGCVTTPVLSLDDGNYVASVHTFFGLADRSQLIDRSITQAIDYCAKEGKLAHVKNAVGTGVPGLTNLSGNVVFSCEAPQAQR